MSFLPAEAVRQLTFADKFGSPAPVSPGRRVKINALRGTNPAVGGMWAAVSSKPYGQAPLGPLNPFSVPRVYIDPAGNAAAIKAIRDDGTAAIDYAYRYYLTGDQDAAASAVALIVPWTTVTAFDVSANSDADYMWSNNWPMFLAAALMVRGSDAWTTSVENAVKAITAYAVDICSTAYNSESNFAGWGLTLEISSAVILGDRARFERALGRWRRVIDGALVGNVPIHEVYRQGGVQGNGTSGIYYANFLLNAMTQAAEWARFNGVWLYDYVSPDGSSLKGLWELCINWVRYPQDYPYNTSGTPTASARVQAHVEILHALWPNEDSAAVIASGVGVSQDYFGLTRSTLAFRGQPLLG